MSETDEPTLQAVRLIALPEVIGNSGWHFFMRRSGGPLEQVCDATGRPLLVRDPCRLWRHVSGLYQNFQLDTLLTGTAMIGRGKEVT